MEQVTIPLDEPSADDILFVLGGTMLEGGSRRSVHTVTSFSQRLRTETTMI